MNISTNTLKWFLCILLLGTHIYLEIKYKDRTLSAMMALATWWVIAAKPTK